MRRLRRVNEAAIGWISTTDSLMLGFGLMLLLALHSTVALDRSNSQGNAAHAAQTSALAATARAEALEQQLTQLHTELVTTRRQLETSTQQRRGLEDKVRRAVSRQGEATREVLGFQGRFERVVFVIDTSHSMTIGLPTKTKGGLTAEAKYRRWDKTRKEILSWASNLQMAKLHLILFNSNIKSLPEPGKYYDMRGSDRDFNLKTIADALNSTEPRHQTNTLEALRLALKLPEVDTVILFTDGKPELKDKNSTALTAQVLELARDTKGIPINVVGIGDYYKSENGALGDFLHSISEITGGEFIGR